jgi:hypothetical protein
VRQLWSLGVADGTATVDGLSPDAWSATSSTSGWYHFPTVDEGTYDIMGAPPAGSWWTFTSLDTCPADLTAPGAAALCNFGLWWGQDPPGGTLAMQNAEGALPGAGETVMAEATFGAMADATVH